MEVDISFNRKNGFKNVLFHGQSSCDDDNPYLKSETDMYNDYKRGAIDGERLLSIFKRYQIKSVIGKKEVS